MTAVLEKSLAPNQPVQRGLTLGLRRVRPPHVIAAALVIGSAVSRLGPPGDPDVWWHLRAGDWILSHHRLPSTDEWSAIASGHRWLDHEWLSQVLLALGYHAGGYRGVSVINAACLLALLALLAYQAFRRTTPYRAAGITVLAVLGTYGGWAARPQLASFLLLVPAASLLRRGIRTGRIPWSLMPMTWLWANLHGLWVLGVGMVLAVATGLLLEHRRSGVTRATRYGLLAVGMLAAAAVTPNGPRILAAPLEVSSVGKYVSEWGPTPLLSIYGLGFFGLLVVYLVAVARRNDPIQWTELMPVLFAAVLGLRYIRTVAPATVILVPYVAATLASRPQHPPRRLDRISVTALIGTVCAGVAGAIMVARTTPPLPENAPVAATAAINGLTGPQRVLNEYGTGGWVLWAAPESHPLIDGRAELYGNGYIGAYLDALAMRGPNWLSFLGHQHPTVALLHRDVPAATGLQREAKWRPIYEDRTWIVLMPPAKGTQALPPTSASAAMQRGSQ